VILRGVASTAAKSEGVEITGIDVEKEKEMFTLSAKIIPGTGSFFGPETKGNTVFKPVFIGEKLAKDLNIIRYIITAETLRQLEEKGVPSSVTAKLSSILDQRYTSDKKFKRAVESLLTPKEIKKYALSIREATWSYREGSRIILSFLDINNVQTGAAFRVCGIFRTNNDILEGTSLFVPIDDLRKLTGMPADTYHRVIARLGENDLTDDATRAIRNNLPDYEVLNWKEIVPDLAMIADMIQQIYGVFMAIILAALAFGIANTMLMAVLERTREIGMLDILNDHARINFPFTGGRNCRNGYREGCDINYCKDWYQSGKIL
jgi:ABC-type lipoprotein release transport system permease subunit